MRKVSSKSNMSTKKNKTVITDSKKNSRITKGSSCVKINSQVTEEKVQNYGGSMPVARTSSQTLSQKIMSKMPGHLHLVDKPSTQTVRQSSRRRDVAKSSLETVQHESGMEEVKKLKVKNE